MDDGSDLEVVGTGGEVKRGDGRRGCGVGGRAVLSRQCGGARRVVCGRPGEVSSGTAPGAGRRLLPV
jgi:hypothetical protein